MATQIESPSSSSNNGYARRTAAAPTRAPPPPPTVLPPWSAFFERARAPFYRQPSSQATTTAAAATSSDPLRPHRNDDGGDDDEGEQQPEEEQHLFWELLHFAKNRNWKKKAMTAFIMVSSAFVLVDVVFFDNVRNAILVSLEWMIRHPFGAVYSFLGFFVVATLLFVPPAILYFGAGYAFTSIAGFGYGVLVSSAVSFIGSCVGAVLAFVRARYMMRDLILLFAKRYPIVQAADHAFEQNGFEVMFLLRLWYARYTARLFFTYSPFLYLFCLFASKY